MDNFYSNKSFTFIKMESPRKSTFPRLIGGLASQQLLFVVLTYHELLPRWRPVELHAPLDKKALFSSDLPTHLLQLAPAGSP